MAKSPETHDDADYRLGTARVSMRDGVLFADDFDDVYFSRDNGLEETRHVFLDGNDVQERMRNSAYLAIAETGFGTGLNLLAVMAEMAKCPDIRIDYLSVEAFPLTVDEMRSAHDSFPELADHAAALRAALPPPWPGQHVVALMEGHLTLHLLYGMAETMLAKSVFSADCWFLDGFSPARNPDFWSPDLCGHIARLTRAGGSLASFTAASAVRRGLQAAGFVVEKRPGYGRKREMIVGQKPLSGKVATAPSRIGQKVAILGGGIAGAAVAAGLQRRGMAPVIIEAGDRLANGASGNRYALQSPRLAVDHNIASRLSANCLVFAARSADDAGASVATPVIALDHPEREATRHAKFRRQHWPVSLVRTVTGEGIEAVSGLAVDIAAMQHDYGRVISPKRFVDSLANHAEVITDFSVANVAREQDAFVIHGADGRCLRFGAVVLAAGASMNEMLTQFGVQGVPIDITSGQVSHIPATTSSDTLRCGLSFGGYLTPAIDGMHELGATFEREPNDAVTSEGHTHNLHLLPESLRQLFADTDVTEISGRTARRASTPDRNPIWGQLDNGLFVIGALGARGFTFAPLLGDQLAALIAGHAVSFDLPTCEMLDPYRFRMRSRRL